MNAAINVILPGYLDLAGSKILSPRDFRESDSSTGARVAIVNELFARQYWEGDAIGRQFTLRGVGVTVVGVVRDTTRRNYRSELRPIVFFPAAQEERPELSFLIATRGSAFQVVAPVRDAVSAANRHAIIGRPQTLADYNGTGADAMGRDGQRSRPLDPRRTTAQRDRDRGVHFAHSARLAHRSRAWH